MRMSNRAGLELYRPMSGGFENAVIPMSNMLTKRWSWFSSISGTHFISHAHQRL